MEVPFLWQISTFLSEEVELSVISGQLHYLRKAPYCCQATLFKAESNPVKTILGFIYIITSYHSVIANNLTVS